MIFLEFFSCISYTFKSSKLIFCAKSHSHPVPSPPPHGIVSRRQGACPGVFIYASIPPKNPLKCQDPLATGDIWRSFSEIPSLKLTASSHLKMGRFTPQKETIVVFQSSIFRGAMLFAGSVTNILFNSPSLTWNLKMMVFQKESPYSRVPFSGSMLNFGRVISVNNA